MEGNKSKERAITLIALVVTIVVLLILAGVSIAMLSGENGIIKQAQEAKLETAIATEKEQLNLAVTDAKNPGLITNEKTLTNITLQESLDKIAGKEKTEVKGESVLKVLFKESNRIYYIDADEGKTIQTNPQTNIFTYTQDGYITGIKDEYFLNSEGVGCISNRYASTKNVRIASRPEYYVIRDLENLLIIPNKIDNTNIIGIDDGAFEYIVNIKKVFIEDGIISIGKSVFSNCDNLTYITIPDTVTSIGNNAFTSCINLRNIKIPYGVTSIGDATFSVCNSLTNITIPKSVTSIGEGAFFYCKSLTSIVIPENVTSIQRDTFSGSSNLKTILVLQEEGVIANAPWGAYDATIKYGNEAKKIVISEFSEEFLKDKSQEDLEEMLLKSIKYTGTYEQYLADNNRTREDLEEVAAEQNMTYKDMLKYALKSIDNSWLEVEYEVYIQGDESKTIEELRELFFEKNGITLDEIVTNLETTKEQFLTDIGCRTEEDFYKYEIYVK